MWRDEEKSIGVDRDENGIIMGKFYDSLYLIGLNKTKLNYWFNFY